MTDDVTLEHEPIILMKIIFWLFRKCVKCSCLYPPAYLYTGLYELWKTGRYKSYPPGVLVDLVARILALVPPWTRVYRVQR